MDRNPWLMSVAIMGFAWFLVSLFLTHRIISQLDISSDGRITNKSGEIKTGIRIDGVELADIPAYGSVKVKLNPQQRRFRISTFSPTGFFYSWTFQPSKKSASSDLGESVVWRRGNSLARIDWKLWFRRGRFTANVLNPNFRLRPIAEAASEPQQVSFNRQKVLGSDAALWALLLSFFVFFVLGVLSLRVAPLWAGIIFFVWVFLISFGVFFREKFRYWGKLNFFLSWIALVLVLVAAKEFLEPWMISTAVVSVLFIPFALHLKLASTDNMFRRIVGILAVAMFTSLTLSYSQALIEERFQSRHYAFLGHAGGNGINWGPSLASTSIRTAERFLARGQGVFWVDFTREDQTRYLQKLPYWRESTFYESRAGLNWSGKVNVADAGLPLNVNLFLPGKKPLQLLRQPPTNVSAPTVTAYDVPGKITTSLRSLRVLEIAKGLKMDPQKPVEASTKVIEWMRSQNLRYTLRPGRIADVDEFLFRKKAGLCQHFAGTLAYILRAANIPTRVVAGYYGGEVDPDGETLIMRDLDAHAWVEVWNPNNKTWFLVDPTAQLFPNEYREDTSNPWLMSITRWVVILQKRWIKIQDHLMLILVTFAVSMSLLILLVIYFSRKKQKSIEDKFQSSIKVREWESRMLKRFHKTRHDFESLSAYYNRLAEKNTDKLSMQLKAELDAIVQELYEY